MNSQITLTECRSSDENEQLFGSSFDIAIYFSLFICIEAVFVNNSLQVVLCPIIAFLFVYLYFIKKDTILVTFFIIIANDSLGTIFAGRISFYYLLLFFLILEITQHSIIQVRLTLLMVLAAIMAAQPLFTNAASFNMFFNALVSVLILICQYNKYERSVFIERMMVSISIIVGLIAIHTLITGGVIYAEAQKNEYYVEYQRRGVLGVGIGDPNFSSLLLCTGIGCTLNNRSFRWYVKAIVFVVTTAAMFVTLSTAGLLALILVLLLSATVNRKLAKGVRRIGVIVLIVLLITQIYFTLPQSYHIADVDQYINRMELKYVALITGDIYSVTTGRSGISDSYLVYINEVQPFGKVLFGGNSVLQLGYETHNTYMTWILQFGFIGLFFLLAYIVNRLMKIYFDEKNDERKIGILLKLLYLFFIASISVHDGSTFVLLFFFLFVI